MCLTSDCGTPTLPDHGSFTLNGSITTYQATATQSCNTRYYLSSGSGIITCLASGLWSAYSICSYNGTSISLHCVRPVLTNILFQFTLSILKRIYYYVSITNAYSIRSYNGWLTSLHFARLVLFPYYDIVGLFKFSITQRIYVELGILTISIIIKYIIKNLIL